MIQGIALSLHVHFTLKIPKNIYIFFPRIVDVLLLIKYLNIWRGKLKQTSIFLSLFSREKNSFFTIFLRPLNWFLVTFQNYFNSYIIVPQLFYDTLFPNFDKSRSKNQFFANFNRWRNEKCSFCVQTEAVSTFLEANISALTVHRLIHLAIRYVLNNNLPILSQIRSQLVNRTIRRGVTVVVKQRIDSDTWTFVVIPTTEGLRCFRDAGLSDFNSRLTMLCSWSSFLV